MNTKNVIYAIIMAVAILAVTAVAIHFATVMNENMSQFSRVEEPVSVLDGLKK